MPRVTDRDTFLATYGPLFEHSPWVAEDAYAKGPFSDEDEVYDALTAAMYEAPRERQLALLRAHPDLGARARMTPASTREQAGAGLDRLSADEYDALMRANAAYKARFGMPFVICVGEHDKDSILAAAQARVRNDPDAEVETALGEVAKIARLRMERV
jgi:OHCU decarboxylase